MSLTVLEVLERTGLRDTNRGLAYIKDGLLEIQSHISDKIERTTMNVVNGTRFYGLPSNLIELKDVYRLYDGDGKYVRINRLQNIDILQDDSSSTATTDDDIIMI